MYPYLLIVLISTFFLVRWATRLADKREYAMIKAHRADANPVSNAVMRGYQAISKVTGKPFFVRYWQKDYMVLPAKYLPDVRRARKAHLDFTDSISDIMFLYNWIGDLFKSDRMAFAVIKGINPQLSKLSHALFEESSFAFERELELRGEESKSSGALELMTALSLRTMTRVIAGKGLSRNQAFLDATHNYFNGNFLTGFIMLNLPFSGRLRDVLAWPLYKYHQHSRQQRLIEMIKPVVAERMEDHRLGINNNVDFDAIQCTLNVLDDFPFEDNARNSPVQTLSHETLHLVWASGQSPALSLTSVLFKLLEEPSYIEPLREEAQAAIEKHGWTDPIFNELPKMDSFIRESNRLHPTFSLITTGSVRDKPFTFSDGLTIPPDSRIGFPTEALQQDPDSFTNPLKFDGFRFVELTNADTRQENGVNRWAASHPSYSNLTFGYGNHACPGRFIAVRLIKVLRSRILLDYDITWDRKGGEPLRFVLEGISLPNVTQKVTFKRRAKAPGDRV